MIRFIFMSAILISWEFQANAKTTLNSMCYALAPGGSVEGSRSHELFEIGSVSKVVTAFWALRNLGPFFRFQTRIHITPVGSNLFDVHIQGGRDPFWGRHLTHLLFSELNRGGISAIRHLTFDENLTFRWSVVTDYILPSHPTMDDIRLSLQKHIIQLESEYRQTRQEAASVGLTLLPKISLKVQKVEFLPKDQFTPIAQTRSYVLKSAPLHRYLKEMNVVSNNHVADRLFDYLGGVAKFRSFIEKDLEMDDRDLQFINGSGDSLLTKNQESQPVKLYNKATCEAILQILLQLEAGLNPHQLHLKDIMAVSGADKSTLTPRFDSIPNSLVGKTGTVDPAITLAGMISTTRGDLYFGVFLHTEGPGDWGTAKDMVREKVFELIRKFGGHRRFDYVARVFMPFDQKSSLVPLEPPASLAFSSPLERE